MMFKFEKFFFCFGLRTGTFIIGWVGLVNSIFALSLFFSNITETVYEYALDDNSTNRILIEQDPSDDLRRGVLTLELVSIMVNLLLLYGTYANKPGMIFPWLVIKVFIYFIATFIVVILASRQILYGNYREGFAIHLIGLAVLFLLFYCWFCVYNYYERELKYSTISRQIIVFVEKNDRTPPKNNEDLPPSYESVVSQT